MTTGREGRVERLWRESEGVMKGGEDGDLREEIVALLSIRIQSKEMKGDSCGNNSFN
jgi:hypothetical protein